MLSIFVESLMPAFFRLSVRARFRLSACKLSTALSESCLLENERIRWPAESSTSRVTSRLAVFNQ